MAPVGRQQEIYDFVSACLAERNEGPGIAEIARKLSIAEQTASIKVNAMVAKRLLVKAGAEVKLPASGAFPSVPQAAEVELLHQMEARCFLIYAVIEGDPVDGTPADVLRSELCNLFEQWLTLSENTNGGTNEAANHPEPNR